MAASSLVLSSSDSVQIALLCHANWKLEKTIGCVTGMTILCCTKLRNVIKVKQ